MAKTPRAVRDDLEAVGREAVDTTHERLTDFVSEKPVVAVGVSILIGILLGKLFL